MRNPFFDELADAQTILLAGAGGGFDLFAGLPLYHSLRAMGKSVHLANLTFSDLYFDKLDRPVPALARITANCHISGNYCPEAFLSRWLESKSMATPIYAIERTGVAPVIEAYRWLADELKPDAIILIDGGTDSLLRGDETGLGTPEEDLASLAAVDALSCIKHRFLVCLGFGIDTFHGVSHGLVLENISALISDGGYLGAWSLMKEAPEFSFYREACDYVFARMPRHQSIVNTSIIDATTGWFGDHHATKRTEGSPLFINPLMSLYWAFHLKSVTGRHLFLDQIRHTRSYAELRLAIDSLHSEQKKIRPWREIPC
jgi:hypothetical protein